MFVFAPDTRIVEHPIRIASGPWTAVTGSMEGTFSQPMPLPDGTSMDRDAVIDVECDIWIPAARPDVVNEDNVQRLNTRLVVEGANIPFTHGAEKTLHEKGVLCVPDFIANAGGVICAAMEYHGSTQSAALQAIEEKLRRNTEQVLETARREQVLPRQAAMAMAEQRVRKAMGFRRWSLFSSAPDYT
jgi:glutamate dehydrogenase (NAD(P)+)